MAAGAPTVLVELLLGSWTDVTAWVDGEVTIERGVRSPVEEPQPGTCRFALSCADPVTGVADARWLPANPLGAYFRLWGEGVPVRVTVSKGAASSVRFLGEVSDVAPNMAETLSASTVAVSAVDSLGRLARRRLRNWTYELSRTYNATAYWPMSTANVRGAAIGSSLISGRLGYPTSVYPKYVAPKADGTALCWFEAGGCAKFEPANSTDASAMYGPTNLGTAADWGFSAWVASSDTDSLAPIVTLYSADRSLKHRLYWSPAYEVGFWSVMADDGSTVTSESFPIVAGQPYHVGLEWAYGVPTVWMGGQLMTVPTPAYTSWVPALAEFGGAQECQIAHAVMFPSSLSVDGQDFAGGNGTTLQTFRLAVVVGAWTDAGLTVTDTADFEEFAAAFDTQGMTALDAFRVLAATAGSTGWDPGTGEPTILARAINATPALTVDVEADCSGAPTLRHTAEGLVSTVTVKGAGEETTASDAVLRSQIGDVSADMMTALWDANDRLSVGSTRIALGRDGATRIESVVVDFVTAQNNLYAAWFDCEPRSVVRVSGLPSTTLGVSRFDGMILGWSETIGVGTYLADVALGHVPTVSTIGSSPLSFGDGVATLAASVTAGATTMQIARSGGEGLSTNAADYPMDLDVNAERVTVSSAPASSASPQTVTVVRGVAPSVARAHAAGEPVDTFDAFYVTY